MWQAGRGKGPDLHVTLKIITVFSFFKHCSSVLLTKMLVLALFVETAATACAE